MRRWVGEYVGSSAVADRTEVVAAKARERKRARIGIWILVATLFFVAVALEVHTSWLQSKVLSAAAARLTFSVTGHPF